MDTRQRSVIKIIEPESVVEGAGVRLKRTIATQTLDHLDPFLLFDHFASTRPEDYQAGFPLHPHRGIETVTYVLAGEVRHKDTLGNEGSIGAGDVQWMTAAGGLLHEEMPQVRPEGIAGFQLWVNMPAKLKMTPPRYQDIRSNAIPDIQRGDGVRIRVVAGTVDALPAERQGVSGPISGIPVDPTYLDVLVPAHGSFTYPIPRGHTAFAYVFEGEGVFARDENGGGNRISETRLVVWADGDYVKVETSDQPVRFLLIAGKPLREPIARYGPFVMNTQEEIAQALADLRRGTFVWSETSPPVTP
ncbi:MAG: pirin family protein [Nitrospirales bacterium]